MKQFLFFISFSLLTSASQAACVSSSPRTSGAASQMMSGVRSIRGSFKISDLQQKLAKTLYTPSWNARDARNASAHLQDGDTVIVRSGGSTAEMAAQYKAYDELLDAREQARLYGEKHEVYKINEKIRAMELQLPQVSKTRVYSNINIYEMEQALFQLKRDGVQVLSIQKIPAKVAGVLKSHARNGVILASTAVALSLVSAEEIASGKIRSYTDAELTSLCR